MKFQDKKMNAYGCFHSTLESANKAMRSHALIYNFSFYNSNTIRNNGGIRSPFEKINGFIYRQNWLENLLVASSLNGCRL